MPWIIGILVYCCVVKESKKVEYTENMLYNI